MSAARLRKAAGWPARCLDLEGMRVRLKADIATSLMILPAGSFATISRGWRWCDIAIKSEPCPHCGVMFRATRVDWRHLDPIRDPDMLEPAR